ncbi:MAG: hypothetical protein ACOX4G_02900 [Limnochordia bacterium]
MLGLLAAPLAPGLEKPEQLPVDAYVARSGSRLPIFFLIKHSRTVRKPLCTHPQAHSVTMVCDSPGFGSVVATATYATSLQILPAKVTGQRHARPSDVWCRLCTSYRQGGSALQLNLVINDLDFAALGLYVNPPLSGWAEERV